VTVHLHIERLVLDGLALGAAPDRDALGAAVQGELRRLALARGVEGWPAQGVAVRRLSGPAVALPGARDAAPAAALGTGIAGAVHGAIDRAVRP
jgi:hypothetical protein